MSWLSRLINPRPDPALTAMISQQQAEFSRMTQAATAATNAALRAQQDAQAQAAAAAVPVADSESARKAMDNKLRKLSQGFSGIGMPQNLGAPPVGYRLLSGA